MTVPGQSFSQPQFGHGNEPTDAAASSIPTVQNNGYATVHGVICQPASEQVNGNHHVHMTNSLPQFENDQRNQSVRNASSLPHFKSSCDISDLCQQMENIRNNSDEPWVYQRQLDQNLYNRSMQQIDAQHQFGSGYNNPGIRVIQPQQHNFEQVLGNPTMNAVPKQQQVQSNNNASNGIVSETSSLQNLGNTTRNVSLTQDKVDKCCGHCNTSGASSHRCSKFDASSTHLAAPARRGPESYADKQHFQARSMRYV